jgi:hypothetical protein
MIDQTILQLIDAVPDYKAFLTVDEMTVSSRRLAQAHPDKVDLLTLGQSRAGYPIEVLKIGQGKRRAMLVGLPHPNEPIGAMMLEFLTWRLAEDPALLEALDTTWTIVKCIDPDGTKLNEGWFSGPFTVTNYARHFYRPPAQQQVEWTFPINYKTYSFNTPLPETRAWMKLIDEHPPHFMYSLHNAGFGGVYLYLSHDMPNLYAPFYELVHRSGLPLHLGEPEVPFIEQYSKAVFGMIGLRNQYDFMAKHQQQDPAETLTAGAGSYEYAARAAQPTFLVCEMPYFYNAAIHDTTESDVMRRDVALAGLAEQRRIISFIQSWMDKLDLKGQSAFHDAIRMNLQAIPNMHQAMENHLRTAPEMERLATAAEKYDSQYVTRFYYVLILGVFLRMLEDEHATIGESETLRQALEAAQDAFNAETGYLEANMNYSAIPIRKLVQVQLATGLLVLQGIQPS